MEVLILTVKSPESGRLLKDQCGAIFLQWNLPYSLTGCIVPGYNGWEKTIAKWLHKQF